MNIQLTTVLLFDLHDDSLHQYTAGVDWTGGHSDAAYGPPLSGASVSLYEGARTTHRSACGG